MCDAMNLETSTRQFLRGLCRSANSSENLSTSALYIHEISFLENPIIIR